MQHIFEFEAPTKQAAKRDVGAHLDRAFHAVPDYAPCPFDRAIVAAKFYQAIDAAAPHDLVALRVYGGLVATPDGNGGFVRSVLYSARTAAGAAREA